MKSSQETCYIGIGIFGREKNRYFGLFPLPFLLEKYFYTESFMTVIEVIVYKIQGEC